MPLWDAWEGHGLADRPVVVQLGKDFPRLWKAPTTSSCDRKRMLRLLIRDITVVNDPESKYLHLQVRWQGGATDTIEVSADQNAPTQCAIPICSLPRSTLWPK
jgi:hypothetical protein